MGLQGSTKPRPSDVREELPAVVQARCRHKHHPSTCSNPAGMSPSWRRGKTPRYREQGSPGRPRESPGHRFTRLRRDEGTFCLTQTGEGGISRHHAFRGVSRVTDVGRALREKVAMNVQGGIAYENRFSAGDGLASLHSQSRSIPPRREHIERRGSTN